MNKKLKFGLFGLAGLAVAGTVGGVTAGVLLNQNQTTLKSNNVSSSVQNNTVGEYSFGTTYNATSQTFNIHVKNSRSENGLIKLINPKAQPLSSDSNSYEQYFVDSLEGVNAGTKVYLAIFTEMGTEARNIKVTGANENISLGTEKIDTPTYLKMDNGVANLFSFELPTNVSIVDDNKDNSNQMEEGFPIDQNGTLTVSATYVKSEVAGWTYNYNYRSYVYNVTKDMTLDDSDLNLNLIKQVREHNLQTQQNDTINFILFLNNHNVQVDTFTIPSGVTLTLINNEHNGMTKEGPNRITQKEGGEGFVLLGVLARYSSVDNQAKVDSPKAR